MHTPPELISEVASMIYQRLQLTEPISVSFIQKLIEMLLLFDKKQHDYGSTNIGQFGTYGIVVRLNDKMERLKNVIAKRRGRVKNETIRDTLIDMANYAIIAMLVEEGGWPKV